MEKMKSDKSSKGALVIEKEILRVKICQGNRWELVIS